MKNLITCLSVCVLSGTALATTWTVDDSGGADFDNIQAAIDAASDGDEIIVMPGTYTSTQDGHVVNMLGKAVTLRSSDPSDPDVVAATIIDGENTRRGLACFNEETSKTIISGFTITNGFSVDFDYNGDGGVDWGERSGGGMYNNGSPMMTNCTFTNNTSNVYGGGMYNYNESSPTLTNCTFTDNTANNNGGGMRNDDSSPTLTNCTFTGNTATGGGGGGMVNYYSNPSLTNCTFTDNSAYDGGGMSNSSSSPTLENCTFENNNAFLLGGGMNNYSSSNPTLTNCTFEGNTATSYGGGMYNSNSSPTLTGCTFDNNITNGSGGGMYNNNYSSPTLTGCTIENNSANGSGGGMWIDNYNSNPSLTYTTVCANTPDQIYGDYWTDDGGNTVAYECPPDDDDDNDGVPNNIDNCYLYNPDQADCNENEFGDVCDIADGTSYDINDNDIPDECEDSDGDGFPDDMDAFPNDPNEWADSDGDGVGDNEDTAPLGGCCVSTGCYQTTAIACDGLGGTWLDASANCDDCPAICAEDINGDGVVDVSDLLAIIAAWGVCP